jgi:hypothetical protein
VLLGELARFEALAGRRDAARRRIDDGLRLLGDQSDGPSRRVFWGSQVQVALLDDRPWEARDLLQRMSSDSVARSIRAAVLAELGLLDLADGGVDDAASRLGQAVAMLDGSGFRLPALGLSQGGLGLARVLQGDASSGVDLLDGAAVLLRGLGARPVLARVLMLRAQAALHLRDLDGAHAALAEAAVVAPPGWQPHVERWRQRLLADGGSAAHGR